MQPPVKLPRTGIEQVFTAERPRFIETHREFERIASVNVSTELAFGVNRKILERQTRSMECHMLFDYLFLLYFDSNLLILLCSLL